MSTTVDQFKALLQVLPPLDRAELAEFLVRSLEQDAQAIDDAWRDELVRRSEEIKNGQVTGTPAEQVFARIREKYS